jgi:hypothetical protein
MPVPSFPGCVSDPVFLNQDTERLQRGRNGRVAVSINNVPIKLKYVLPSIARFFGISSICYGLRRYPWICKIMNVKNKFAILMAIGGTKSRDTAK